MLFIDTFMMVYCLLVPNDGIEQMVPIQKFIIMVV